MSYEPSSIVPGDQVTLSYQYGMYNQYIYKGSAQEKLEKDPSILREEHKIDGIWLKDMIGGSFMCYECRCGQPFCIGDICRRYLTNNLRDEDMYLMFVSDEKV